jgi:hypothetical protein
MESNDEIYNIIFNNQPLSCEEIRGRMNDPPKYQQLLHILWFGIPGIRVYRKTGQHGHLPEAYFTPNKFSNKEQYNELSGRYKPK